MKNFEKRRYYKKNSIWLFWMWSIAVWKYELKTTNVLKFQSPIYLGKFMFFIILKQEHDMKNLRKHSYMK